MYIYYKHIWINKIRLWRNPNDNNRYTDNVTNTGKTNPGAERITSQLQNVNINDPSKKSPQMIEHLTRVLLGNATLSRNNLYPIKSSGESTSPLPPPLSYI